MPNSIAPSPSTSSFVPLAMLDSVKPPTRTLTSANRAGTSAGSRGPRPSLAPHNSSGQLQPLSARDKAEIAKRDALAMMETLGMAKPQGALDSPREDDERSFDRPASTTAQWVGDGGKELERSKSLLSERNAELARARAELSVLNQEKTDLTRRVDKLEKDRAALVAGGAAAGPSQVATQGGMTARQVEELERQFAAQESLLNGYQKDSERSFKELEALKAKQRRMAELLARFCGPNWEADLLDSALPISMVAVPSGITASNSFSSPALRTRLGGPRPSLLGTPLGTPTTQRDGTPRLKKVSNGDESFEEGALEEGERAEVDSSAQTADAEAVRQQLEAVQAIVRAMQERLIARDGELDTVERRAREEGVKAAEKLRDVHAAAGRAGLIAV